MLNGDGGDEAGGGGTGTLLRQLEETVQINPEDSSLRFQLGLGLWEHKSKDKAAEQFLISAKLNPHHAPSFKYLGHYYSSSDSQRALKCYQRALALDPEDAESGEALCDLLDNASKESLEMAVCVDASQKSARAFWAFRRLGYLHLSHNRCSEAVPKLQHAIRGYPTSPQLWESLGLAYQRLGMFTAAIKSYGRSLELEDTRVFSLVQSGNIYLMLGSFRKGVEQFQQAVVISPKNVAANYGLASGFLGLSRECMNVGAFRWGASLLEDASKVADLTARLSGNFSCIWKLHGDIQLTYAKCFPWTEHNVETFNSSILSWKKTCYLAAISARKSYQRALHLVPLQSNLYMDIAIASDLISSMDKNWEHDVYPWQLPEKMAFGALLLESHNYEFWVALGYLAGYNALKQHALIRGLQLDVSLAIAWAYLGKFYREEGEKKLARQAFDCSRSIDPSLALPWAGMSADTHAGEPTLDDAFESCLRAVQILPLADFQIGFAKLALLSGHIASSQVSVAIQQAVQRAPHYPESHNLNGLVCEARCDFEAAVASYKLARSAINISSNDALKRSHLQDITTNLARSLNQAGYAADAIKECEYLEKEGILHTEGMHIYVLSLWKLGKNDLAILVARKLAARVSTMNLIDATSSVSFICRLLYQISGIDKAINNILEMPKKLFQSSKVRCIVYAIHALDQHNQLDLVVSCNRHPVFSEEENYLVALAKLVKHASEHSLGFQAGISHLKKAIHVYPNSNLMRNLLGHLLLSAEEWEDAHVASRCCIIDNAHGTSEGSLKPGCEILGAGAVACYSIGNKDPRLSFPTCGYQCLNGPGAVQVLQKYLHREPWNFNARYLLILNLLQKAREERFPRQLCVIVQRLISVSLSNELYSGKKAVFQYQKFQLLLCISEISMQCRNHKECIKYVNNALSLPLPNNYLFFGSLLLCRAYASEGNYINLQEEYTRCLKLKTDYHIGWMCLKILESQYDVQTDANISELIFKERKNSWNMWMAVYNLVLALICFWNQEFLPAEESLAQACSLAGVDSCLFLCHGVVCLELARQFESSQFLSLAVRSLKRAHENSVIPLPLVFLLLAQAEGSLGSKEKWRKNLSLEWYSWSPEMRPAELFFQMHLLVRQPEAGFDSSSSVEFCQSPRQWVLQAIHTNPSCLRYWKVLQKLME